MALHSSFLTEELLWCVAAVFWRVTCWFHWWWDTGKFYGKRELMHRAWVGDLPRVMGISRLLGHGNVFWARQMADSGMGSLPISSGPISWWPDCSLFPSAPVPSTDVPLVTSHLLLSRLLGWYQFLKCEEGLILYKTYSHLLTKISC